METDAISQVETMDKSLPIVGVGASAGGLEALRQMLGGSGRGGMPDMAFVVIQHLDPTHESMMAQLVERYTSMRVHQIDGGEKVQGGCVYIIPPGHGLSIEDGVLHLTEFTDPRGMRRPIDDFFETLAEDAKGMAACVILSGTGADGSRGMRAIKEHGGICVVQEPTSARYDGMPLSAKGTGLVDFVTDPEDIIDCLATYFGRKTGDELEDDAAVVADHLDELCATLRNAVGHDFTQYKRATLMRRVARRMQVLGITDGDDYLKRLKNDAEECDALFRDLLINVTRFFRDADAFDVLRSEVIEPMVRNSSDRDELRVWVPGCSSGEEAFTLAMLFADAMESLDRRPIVNIFASDIDEQMLRQARAALYPIAHLPDIPTDLRNRYTLGRGDHFTLAPQIRDMVRFSSHSVIKDPPFSRIDLVSCRNLLIYFDDKLQQAVLPMFHYALAPGGALFLGPSETIGRHDDLFKPIDGPNRLFRRTDKAPKYPLDIQLGAPSKKPRRSVQRQDTASMPGRGVSDAVAVLTENYAPASLLVDREGSIISSWGPVGRYFAFPSSGEERQSASALAKPGLREVLGGFLRQMVEKSRRQTMRDVEVQTDFGAQSVQLFGEPVRDGTFLIVLRETGGFQPRDVDRFIEVDEVDDHVAQLEDDLRITRYRLRSTVEELETANEELKSSNEEMMSMNEELQSTNEELTTVNDELKNKVDELTAANADLTNFFDST
jgi:two-component system CheB/CheR fusion protein